MREADEQRESERLREEPEPSPYLRRPRRVEVRRAAVRWKRLALLAVPLAVAAGGAVTAAAYGLSAYLSRSPRFTLPGTPEAAGLAYASREQVARVFAADAGRSVFDAPLEKRRQQLMTLPWVENAWVMRGWPNRVRVAVTERRPAAFVRALNGTLALVDQEGVLLPLPRRGKFALPVLTGVNEALPPAERKRRVARMRAVLEDLDRDSPKRGREVSEIDLTDPNDAAVTVAAGGAAVLVHLGDGRYLERYRYFLDNIESWREQFGAVLSVDLRYEKQVIVR